MFKSDFHISTRKTLGGMLKTLFTGGFPQKSEFPQRKRAGSHSEMEWIDKWLEHYRACFYCHEPLELNDADREHLTPLCRGGKDTIDNIVPACKRCNKIKGRRTLDEFRAARPAFFNKTQIFTANPLKEGVALKNQQSAEEKFNEPGLLRKVVGERENRNGWWKRFPAESGYST